MPRLGLEVRSHGSALVCSTNSAIVLCTSMQENDVKTKKLLAAFPPKLDSVPPL